MDTTQKTDKKKVQDNSWDWLLKATNHFHDRFFRAMFVTLFFLLDFVLFIYSINGRILEAGVFNEAMIYIAGGVFGVFFVLMLLLSFSGMAQNVVVMLVVTLMTVVFFYQFALFDKDNFIETWAVQKAGFLSFIGFIPAVWLVAVVVGILIFFAFKYSMVILVSTFALMGAVAIGAYQTETLNLPKSEYQTVQDLKAKKKETNEHNLVYLMAPNFPSYHFLSTVKDVHFRELRDLTVGFYAINNFEIYPNAFVQKNDAVSNIVDIYNQVDYNFAASGIRGYAEILNDWNFVHGSLDTWGLEENKLYDFLGKKGYQVSTYAMPQFNLCFKKDKLNSDRCVVKNGHTVSLYDKKSSVEKNVFALLGEWVMSLNSTDLKSVAKNLLDMSNLKGMKVLASNRRISIEGSPYLLEKMYEDFKKDKNGQYYMAFVELPSDLYIYDEFCNIKPRREWVSLKDNIIYSSTKDEKRKAYADQAKCLVGALQMYMEDMMQNEKLANTDIVIQGVSTIKELAEKASGKYGDFVTNKLISLGIRKAKNPDFIVNTEICLASDFTKSLITGQDYCYGVEDMKMTMEEELNLEQNLINNSKLITNRDIVLIAENYRNWYEEFRAKSPLYQKRLKKQGGASGVKPLPKVNKKAEPAVQKAVVVAPVAIKGTNRRDESVEVRSETETAEKVKMPVVVEVKNESEAVAETKEPIAVEVQKELEAAVEAKAEVSSAQNSVLEAAQSDDSGVKHKQGGLADFILAPKQDASEVSTEPEKVEVIPDISLEVMPSGQNAGNIEEKAVNL